MTEEAMKVWRDATYAYGGLSIPGENERAAAAVIAAAMAARDVEADEAHKIGIDEGRQEMVREIDLATGGDGEFFASTIPGRGCEDADAMKARVLERFAAMAADKARIAELEGALRRIEGIYRHSREDAAENAYEMQSIATAALKAKEQV